MYWTLASWRAATNKPIPQLYMGNVSRLERALSGKGGALLLYKNESVVRQLLDEYLLPLAGAQSTHAAGSGLLLFGPPGSGKTSLARSMLAMAGFFVCFDGTAAALNSKWVGDTEGKVRQLVSLCTQLAGVPYAVLFDEIDSLVQRRGTAGTEHKVDALTTLLEALDKRGNESLHVIGTTNRKSAIDPAMLRPGRLSVTVHVGRLSAQDRWGFLCSQWRTACLPEDTWSTGNPAGLERQRAFTTATQNFTAPLLKKVVAAWYPEWSKRSESKSPRRSCSP